MNRAGAWSPGKCDGIDVEGEPVGNRVGRAECDQWLRYVAIG
jgi:hypothetical protein